MAGISTSIVINFVDPAAASAANAHLSAEVDNRDDGLNSGKNQFIFGDSPAFLIYKTSNVSFTIQTTAGTAVFDSNGTITIDENITFVAATESSLSKPPQGNVTFTLLGGSGIDVNTLAVSGLKVTSPTEGLAVVRAQYTAAFQAYRLVGVPNPNIADLESYEAIVYILGTVA